MPDFTPPDLSAIEVDESLTPITMPFSTKGGSSFVDGDPEGTRLRMKMFVRESDMRMFTKVWWGPDAEGPPGHGHGGSMAAVLDHTMGICCWVSGNPVVAASITINFHHSIPLGNIYTVETWVEKVEGKKVYTHGEIYLDDQENPYATGSGLFIVQSMERFKGMVDSTRNSEDNFDTVEKEMNSPD
ncbi:MAG: PaaI family thioesterase [Candidatus Hydrogenedentota bacterium]